MPRPTDLCERYTEPHRRYHNADHVRQVVRDAALLAGDECERDRALVALAALAHDVVYDGKPGDDERRSAEWARDQLMATGVADQDVGRVEDLVLATLTHEAAPGDRLAAVLLDADLAILGSDGAGYERYRAAVRSEYGHVPDGAWRVGRAAVLRSLLGRGSLYLTDGGRERWAVAARRNLSGELEGL
ncbi:HD domain-containing protein [Umezawaea sp. Da 62-37]|uniref:HD domain-containing protein n=1 Tax=Umezawaea sp. Da 62-37 TaxID=3075927 RepID=UPI0028F70181|nr:HD domain-containing protein [Umezawaea sp. Da 62-37]WNV82709.1 HD domain-containing protein [Umezawaea sp. Da 62-37]